MSGAASETRESAALSPLLPLLAWSCWGSHLLSMLLPGARGKLGQQPIEWLELSASWLGLLAYASCLWLLPLLGAQLWRWPRLPWGHLGALLLATGAVGMTAPQLLSPLSWLPANLIALWGGITLSVVAALLLRRGELSALWLGLLPFCVALRAGAYFASRMSAPRLQAWAPALGTAALALWLLLLLAVLLWLLRRAQRRDFVVICGCLALGIALCVVVSHPRTAAHFGLLRHSLAAIAAPPLHDGMRMLNGWRALLSISVALCCLLLAPRARPVLWALSPLVLAGGALDVPLGNASAVCAAMCWLVLRTAPAASAAAPGAIDAPAALR